MASNSNRKPYFGITGSWLVAMITFACATDMTLFGYDQAVFSGVVVSNDFLILHHLQGDNNTKLLSTVSAIYAVGCFFGAIIAFGLVDRFARPRVIIGGTLLMTIGAILQASSYSYAHMMVGRIISGLGNGFNTTVAPIWQTETAPAKWRGKLVMLEMLMNIAGFSLCNWINYGLSFRSGSLAWRFPLAFQLIFMILLFGTVPWLPESPRWLIGQGRHEEALDVLSALQGKPREDLDVQTELRKIDESVIYERAHMIRWRDLLRAKNTGNTKALHRLLLGAGTQFMQQFEGINIMSYYLPTVLIKSVGLNEELARLITAINSVTYLLVSAIFIPLVERWGRRSLMLLSTAGQGLCFLLITVLLRFSSNESNGRAIATATIPFFFIYYISFGAGMLGIPWLYPTEINSLPMRTKGSAVATATNWITNFVIVEITPIGIQNLGWRFWIVWTCFNAAFLPIIYFLYPETASRTLEDIDLYYRDNPSLIVTREKDAISTKKPRKFLEHDEEQREITAKQGAAELIEYANEKQ